MLTPSPDSHHPELSFRTTVPDRALESFLIPLDPRAETLREIVEPVVVDEGFELVSLVIVPGSQRSIVRVFVDTWEAETHIGLGDLERLNHLIGDVLDVEDSHRGLFRGQYNLEVSSPGVDRPLTKRRHFEQAVGKRVKLRTRVKLPSGGKVVAGQLVAAGDAGVEVAPDGQGLIPVPWGELEDAHVVFVFEAHTAPKPKRSKKKAPAKKADGQGGKRSDGSRSAGRPTE